MVTAAQKQEIHPAEQMIQFATGFMVSSAVYSVTKAGIPDLLRDGAKSAQELAKNSGSNEDALYRIMRALASIGVFSEVFDKKFALSPAGEYLCKDTPGSHRDMVLWMGDAIHHRTYAEMGHALKTGETVIEKVHGVSCFEYFAQDKPLSEVFNAAMTGFSAMIAPAVLDSYDFSTLNNKTLVDIGGGHGYLLTQILRKYPDIRGTIFDLEHVVAGARSSLDNSGLSSRCQTAAGDFFQSVPPGEAYIMKNIIHDWNDELALKILKCCHRAGIGKTKVILVESILPAANIPHLSKWLDLEMLLLPGGRERTEDEFNRLFAQAGFRLTRVVPTNSPVCVIEAEKIV